MFHCNTHILGIYYAVSIHILLVNSVLWCSSCVRVIVCISCNHAKDLLLHVLTLEWWWQQFQNSRACIPLNGPVYTVFGGKSTGEQSFAGIWELGPNILENTRANSIVCDSTCPTPCSICSQLNDHFCIY